MNGRVNDDDDDDGGAGCILFYFDSLAVIVPYLYTLCIHDVSLSSYTV